MTVTHRDEILSILSDAFKDANGFRPGADYLRNARAMTDAELDKEWNYLCNAIEQGIELEARQQAEALVRWEARLADLIALGAPDKVTAIRWDMDAHDCRNGDMLDVGYYEYHMGIKYGVAVAIVGAAYL